MSKNLDKKIGAVLVQGGGIAGVQASLDLANSGFKVYLVERDGAIGGMMAHLDKTFPTGDCATCIVSPKLVECARNLCCSIDGIQYHLSGWKQRAGNNPGDRASCILRGGKQPHATISLLDLADGGHKHSDSY